MSQDSYAGHILAGAADGGLKVWDKRKLDQAAFSFGVHSRALMRVEWASYGSGRQTQIVHKKNMCLPIHK